MMVDFIEAVFQKGDAVMIDGSFKWTIRDHWCLPFVQMMNINTYPHF